MVEVLEFKKILLWISSIQAYLKDNYRKNKNWMAEPIISIKNNHRIGGKKIYIIQMIIIILKKKVVKKFLNKANMVL